MAKKVDIKKHSLTPKHMKKSSPFISQKQTKLQTVPTYQFQQLEAESKMATFIAVHSTFRSVDHLNELCSISFRDSKHAGFKMHRSKCTAIISNIIGPYFEEELQKDLNDTKFSLFLDESTDISSHKLLGVSVRFFKKTAEKVQDSFLGLVELENGTATEIVGALKR